VLHRIVGSIFTLIMLQRLLYHVYRLFFLPSVASLMKSVVHVFALVHSVVCAFICLWACACDGEWVWCERLYESTWVIRSTLCLYTLTHPPCTHIKIDILFQMCWLIEASPSSWSTFKRLISLLKWDYH